MGGKQQYAYVCTGNNTILHSVTFSDNMAHADNPEPFDLKNVFYFVDR